MALKLILSSNTHGWNLSENFIAEKPLNYSDPWEFGYALGGSRPLTLQAKSKSCVFCRENFVAGLELYDASMQVRWTNDPVVRRDGIPGRGWEVVETRAGSRPQPCESFCWSTGSDRVQRATDGEIFWLLRNGDLPKGIPPGRRCQSRCAGRISLTLRAWVLPRPPLLPPLLIPSRIRYDSGVCWTPRRLTFHIHSWRSAWQTIC